MTPVIEDRASWAGDDHVEISLAQLKWHRGIYQGTVAIIIEDLRIADGPTGQPFQERFKFFQIQKAGMVLE